MKNIIIYDFDGTLTPYPLPKFKILEKCGITNGAENPTFLYTAKQKAQKENIDLYAALYYTYFEIIQKSGLTLTDDNFCMGCTAIEYNNGVIDFLEMLCENNISNYLLSSGIKVFLEKTSISHFFDKIYGTIFHYNEQHETDGINFLMTDKNKVTAIMEILKKNNCHDCSNIIYIGDGFSDYYAMQYIKEHNGLNILVYTDPNSQDLLSIKEKGIADYCIKADYGENSELRNLIKKLCKIKTSHQDL